MKRVVLCAAALLMAAGTVLAVLAAQTYPTRPIRIIVPFNPGGTSDTIARIFGQKVTEAWGQPVVVDIRPGASGIIGTEIAARAPGDGYTLLHGNLSQFATNPSLYSKIPYDTSSVGLTANSLRSLAERHQGARR